MLLVRFFRWLYSLVRSAEVQKVLLLGLDNSGKTTLLNHVRNYAEGSNSDASNTVPTIAVNMANLRYNGTVFNIWDLAGQSKLRKFWECYFENAQHLVFIVDLFDSTRFDSAMEELSKTVNSPKLRKLETVTVLLNKTDLLANYKHCGFAENELLVDYSAEKLRATVSAMMHAAMRANFRVLECSLKMAKTASCLQLFNFHECTRSEL